MITKGLYGQSTKKDHAGSHNKGGFDLKKGKKTIHTQLIFKNQ